MWKEELEKYKKLYGEILFPCAETINLVNKNLKSYMFSYDGIEWERMPENIKMFIFLDKVFRKIPDNIWIGNDELFLYGTKENPDDYEYSNNNGYSWENINHFGGSSWIYHSIHKNLWFQKKYKKFGDIYKWDVFLGCLQINLKKD